MTSDVCRTCLTCVESNSGKCLSSPVEEDLQPLKTIGEVLNDLISELNLDLTESPLICATCYEHLLIGIKFKYKCIKTENVIRNCLVNEAGHVALTDVQNGTDKDLEQLENQRLIVIQVENLSGNVNDEKIEDITVEENKIMSDEVHEIPAAEVIPTTEIKEEEKQLSNKASNKLFECTACHVTFPDYETLEGHARSVHQVEDLYCCKVCQNMFTNAQRAQEHALQHIGSGKYSCEDMIRILPFYVNGRPKTCSVCKKSFLWCCQFKESPTELCCKCLGHRGIFSVLFEKIASENQDKTGEEIEINKFECSVCNKAFLFEIDLKKHLFTHETKRYSCEECGEKFSRKSAVADHMEIVHRGLGAFQCPQCWRRYMKRESFHKHLRSHAGEVFNICEICGKTSMSKSDLAKHIQRHIGHKKYQCPICGKLFVVKYSLLEHERTHDQNYVANNRCMCEVCGKVLSTPSALAMHKAKNCGVERYKCELCDKTFKYKRYLKSHMQDHKEHPKHKCHACGLNYRSWLALRKHQRLQHRFTGKPVELQPTGTA